MPPEAVSKPLNPLSEAGKVRGLCVSVEMQAELEEDSAEAAFKFCQRLIEEIELRFWVVEFCAC